VQLIKDVLDAVGLMSCDGHDSSTLDTLKSGSSEADAAVGDSSADEPSLDTWVTPQGWVTLY
jgi:hypothetical protein